MQAFRYETHIGKDGSLNIPLSNMLFDREVEIIILPKSRQVKKKGNTKLAKSNASDSSFFPLTQEELVERAKQSNDDFKNGRFISQEDLEKESENW